VANPDSADAGYGGILVLSGAEGGCEGVMRLRLRRIDINRNSPSNSSQTLPWRAAENVLIGLWSWQRRNISEILCNRAPLDFLESDALSLRNRCFFGTGVLVAFGG